MTITVRRDVGVLLASESFVKMGPVTVTVKAIHLPSPPPPGLFIFFVRLSQNSAEKFSA
jgi:hypothetical protein